MWQNQVRCSFLLSFTDRIFLGSTIQLGIQNLWGIVEPQYTERTLIQAEAFTSDDYPLEVLDSREAYTNWLVFGQEDIQCAGPRLNTTKAIVH